MGKGYHPQATCFSELLNSIEISISNASSTSTLRLKSASDQKDEDTISTFPFLKLPAELRLRVYRHLLHALCDIRIIKVDAKSPNASKAKLRSHFPNYECSRSSKAYGKMTTYTGWAIDVHPAILLVNRQTYLEASMVLYSENRFIFRGLGFHSEVYSNAAIIPFLEDRSEGSRRLIKQIEYSYSYYFLIRTLIRSDAFLMKLDHSFEETCNYLSQNLQLEHVTLKFYDTLLLGYNVSKDCQLAVDKQNWVQQLIPLVKNLDTFTLISEYGSLNEMLRAAQTYLELKMHKGKQGRAPDSGGTTAGTSSSSF